MNNKSMYFIGTSISAVMALTTSVIQTSRIITRNKRRHEISMLTYIIVSMVFLGIAQWQTNSVLRRLDNGKE